MCSLMAAEDLNRQANSSRLSRLLINKGTQVLRAAFDLKHPPATLASDLNRNKPTLTKLRYKVIGKSHWDKLYPPSGHPDSKNFDITLLTVLLRNICGLAPPATGWDAMPPSTDTSITANILRMKLYRNEVYAHITSTEIDDAQFHRLWEEISSVLIAMGVSKKEIDELKESPMSPEEMTCIQQPEEWKNCEDEVMKKLEEIKGQLQGISAGIGQKPGKNVNHLTHCNFQGNIDLLAKFFYPGTRKWLFRKVDNWFQAKKSDSRVMILTAGPGVGKSVFAAKLCQLYAKKRKLAASHFCKVNISDYRNPHTMLESLASQMCQSVAGFKEKLDQQLQRPHSTQTTTDAFRVLLNDPLHELKVRKPMMIVIDALDETEAGGKSELLDVITKEFPKLPDWIKVFATSRPELPLKKNLSHLNPLEILVNDKDNENDLITYLRGCLSNKCRDDRVIRLLVNKCQGVFLCAYYIQQEIQRNAANFSSIHDIDTIVPRGISSFYEKQFEILEKHLSMLSVSKDDLVQFLAILAAAKGPLPLAFLPGCLGLSGDVVFKIRNGINDIMSAFLPVYDDCLTVYHKSLIDWLRSDGYEEHNYTVTGKEPVGNEWLWEQCKLQYQEIKANFPIESFSTTMQYAVNNGLSHLLELEIEKCPCQDGYKWLIDFVIVHLILQSSSNLVSPNSKFLQAWHRVLSKRSEMDLELQLKFYWHIMVFESQKWVKHSYYCQNVVNSAPFRVFTNKEIKIAKSVIKHEKYVWCENLNVAEETDSPILAAQSLQSDKITSINVSPNHEQVAVAYADGLISIFRLPCLQLTHSFDTEEEFRSDCLAFFPDNSRIIYGRLDWCLNVNLGMRIPFLPNISKNDAKVSSCSFSPNGTRLVTSDNSEVVKLWDVNRQIPLAYLRAGVPVNHCRFSNGGLFIVAKRVNDDEVVRVDGFDQRDSFVAWNAITLQRVDHRDTIHGNPGSCRVSNGMTTKRFPLTGGIFSEFFLSENGNSVDIFQFPRALLVARYPLYPSFESPFAMGVPPAIKYDNRDCILDYRHGSLSIVDPLRLTVVSERRFLPLSRLTTTKVPPIFVGEFVVTVYQDGLFLLKTPSRPPTLPLWPIPRVTCCSFSPDGSRLATCTDYGSGRVWDVETSSVVQDFSMIPGQKRGCWWSTESLWIFNVTQKSSSLLRLPSGERQALRCSETVEFQLKLESTEVLAFSEGILILKCKDGSILTTKILDDEVQPKQILLVDNSVQCAAVSGYSCILTASLTEFILWEENKEGRHWFSVIRRSLPEDEGEPDQFGMRVRYDQRACAIDSNENFAYFITIKEISNANTFFDWTVVDLKSACDQGCGSFELGNFREHQVADEYLNVQLYASNQFLIMRLYDGNTIWIRSHKGFRTVAVWLPFGYQCSRFLFAPPSIPFFPEQSLLALPDECGTFQFIKLHHEENEQN